MAVIRFRLSAYRVGFDLLPSPFCGNMENWCRRVDPHLLIYRTPSLSNIWHQTMALKDSIPRRPIQRCAGRRWQSGRRWRRCSASSIIVPPSRDHLVDHLQVKQTHSLLILSLSLARSAWPSFGAPWPSFGLPCTAVTAALAFLFFIRRRKNNHNKERNREKTAANKEKYQYIHLFFFPFCTANGAAMSYRWGLVREAGQRRKRVKFQQQYARLVEARRDGWSLLSVKMSIVDQQPLGD